MTAVPERAKAPTEIVLGEQDVSRCVREENGANNHHTHTRSYRLTFATLTLASTQLLAHTKLNATFVVHLACYIMTRTDTTRATAY